MIHPAYEEAVMNGNTGGGRGPRRAGALVVVAVVAVLTACSGAPSSSAGSASAEPSTYRANLAFAHCMQTHGLPGFPNPNPSGTFSFGRGLTGNSNSPAARAYDACKYLLPHGSATAPATTSPPGAVPGDCLTSRPPCYALRQFRVAYGIQPLLDRGIDGRGVTVVLPEEAETGPEPPAESGAPPSRGRTVPR